MTLANEARIEVALAQAKPKIRDDVLRVARDGERRLELASLPVLPEYNTFFADWLKSEGLGVELKKWMAKPSGFRAQEDDDVVECSKWVITW